MQTPGPDGDGYDVKRDWGLIICWRNSRRKSLSPLGGDHLPLKLLSKLIVAIICTFIVAVWFSLPGTFEYFEWDLIVAGLIYIFLGIPFSWLIDRWIEKIHWNTMWKTIVGVMAYAAAGSVAIVLGLSIVLWEPEVLQTFQSPVILLLGSESAMLFYMVQWIYNKVSIFIKKRMPS